MPRPRPAPHRAPTRRAPPRCTHRSPWTRWGRALGPAVLALALASPSACTPLERPSESQAETGAEPGTEPGTAPTVQPPDEEPVRIKGLDPHLLLHRQRNGRVEALPDGAVAQAGDLIQISYMAAGSRNGVVVSLDGAGLVTLHHPSRPEGRPTLESRGQHALDHAYELDDARSFERFVFVTSGDEPLAPATVIAAARRLAQGGPAARHSPLPLPERWHQSSIVLHKGP